MKDGLPKFEVIRTCTNLELFTPPVSAKEGGPASFTLGYVGNVASWYLFDPVLECFKILQELEPNARLLVVNQGQQAYIQERRLQFSIPEAVVKLKAVVHAEVPKEMKRINAGIFFIKPIFSKKASMPTRLGEYLASGVPSLCNAGIGDIDDIFEKGKAGVVLREFNSPAKKHSVPKIY